MYFNHRGAQESETIAAIVTPPGEGGVGIIRISGREALAIANRIFSGNIFSYATHTLHLGQILDIEGTPIDEGLALIMKAPRSYTGEDTVELQCHGGRLITQKVLTATLAAGSRTALPGEFTLRAFQNGKIDLTKAEAVQQVIAAKSEQAWQAAEKQLEGKLYEKIASFQRALTEIGALLEAWVDFPEEGLEFATEQELYVKAKRLHQEMSALKATFRQGRRLATPITLCLVGAPNVGKSSLLNALIGSERAIVTPIAGTTRDTVEEELTFGGLLFRLIDTAGMRPTEELIEKEGIARSQKAAKEADLILLVCDVSEPLPTLPPLPEKRTIVVWNKIDLPSYPQEQNTLPYPHHVSISAKEGRGLEALQARIEEVIWEEHPPSKEEVILTNARHFEALSAAIEALDALIEGLRLSLSPEKKRKKKKKKRTERQDT